MQVRPRGLQGEQVKGAGKTRKHRPEGSGGGPQQCCDAQHQGQEQGAGGGASRLGFCFSKSLKQDFSGFNMPPATRVSVKMHILIEEAWEPQSLHV